MAFTYAQLVAQIQSFLGDSGAIFTAEIPTLIALGETKVLRELDLNIFDTTDLAITFTSGTRTVTKPADLLTTRILMYKPSTQIYILELRSFDFLTDYWPIPTNVGTPLYYCEQSDLLWTVAPTPNATTTTSRARYAKRPTGLSDATTTTWLGTNVGDLLLSACLVESYLWNKGDTRLPTWNTTYTEQLKDARYELRAIINKDFSANPGAK